MTIRINQSQNIDTSSRPTISQKPAQANFKMELQAISTKSSAEIEHLANVVKETGERLSHSINFKNLNDYKDALKNLLSKIVKNYELTSEQMFNNQGQKRMLSAIRKIEENSDALTLEMNNEIPDNMKILNRVDAIRGLLVDLLA